MCLLEIVSRLSRCVCFSSCVCPRSCVCPSSCYTCDRDLVFVLALATLATEILECFCTFSAMREGFGMEAARTKKLMAPE